MNKFLLLLSLITITSFADNKIDDAKQTSTSAPLADGETYTGAWTEASGPQMVISLSADQDLTYKAQFSVDRVNIDSTLTYTFEAGTVEAPKILIIARKFFRLVVTNNSGSATTYLRAHVRMGSFGLLTSPLNGNIEQDANSTIVRSLPPGVDIALGHLTGWTGGTKFGRNPDIDIVTAPQDIFNGSGTYTGFNATADENIQALSADVDDQGLLRSSGTATGGSTTTLVDTGATFSTDSVAAGDFLVNDTDGAHALIMSVDSETQLTTLELSGSNSNAATDVYRVVNANDTGAALIKITQILNSSYVEQTPVYIIMNGTTGVTASASAMRISRVQVISAGSSEANEGVITVRQATTTANVFAMVPTTGQTTIAATTVPSGSQMIVKRVRTGITRANGSAGSANIDLMVRPRGEAWKAVRSFEVGTNSPTEFTADGGLVLSPGSDVKFRVISVSDNNTIAEGAFEYFFIKK